jgi:cytochrome c-type biogenesis protein
MEWLQSLLDSSSTPVATAFLLGLLTAISPCPLATNIAAISYISKDVDNRSRILRNGLFYTLGRTMSYALLGIVLIAIIRNGASAFGLQDVLAQWSTYLLGPLLMVIGLYMLLAEHIHIPQFGYHGTAKDYLKGWWGAFLLGVLFAMAFCPTSAVFYFGMLIPMSAYSRAGWLLPVVFALATALPVVLVAWVLAYSLGKIGQLYHRMKILQKWGSIAVGLVFMLTGTYLCFNTYIL